MSATTVPPPRPATLGRVGGQVAESLAWLNSPAAIDGELRRLERAQAGGDSSAATGALLADWRAVQAAQARLVTKEEPMNATVAPRAAGRAEGAR
jgi:hypothetical protein